MDFLDELLTPPAPVEDLNEPEPKQLHQYHHVYVGSDDDAIPLPSLRQTHAAAETFNDLPARLTEFIASLNPRSAAPHLPEPLMVSARFLLMKNHLTSIPYRSNRGNT